MNKNQKMHIRFKVEKRFKHARFGPENTQTAVMVKNTYSEEHEDESSRVERRRLWWLHT